ncbi:MAG: cation diffusion facilitator family transporter [Rhodospirillaceae bacterium]|nr:cation diffusion facilitator family transporter [Rhodospirillaceae bacterium]
MSAPAPNLATDHDHAAATPGAARLMRLATIVAVALAVLMVTIKGVAYATTNSVALLSSLADSGLDLLASGLNFFAVRHALTPADTEHRFGHGKAEPLSALGQSAFIAGSAVLVAVEAASRIRSPVAVEQGDVGLTVMMVATVLTIALVTFQKYVVRKTGSLAIGADSLHYTGDVLMNLTVMVAIYAATTLGMDWADPLFGGGIALFLLVNAGRIAYGAMGHLMDEEMPKAERDKIIAIARRNPQVKNVHELRTRSSGVQAFIQMHIVLDKTLTLMEAHRISDDVENALLAAYPGADVIIHQDPEGVMEVHRPVGGAPR